ncbi:MAG: cysteine--tRNA ligase [Candidatus Magasanikbacteria bacterium]
MILQLYNSLTKTKEEFTPLTKGEVKMYTCGPTVYHYAHIGNLRAFLFADILKRVLKYNEYKVKHVMNITDVGHLTDDADEGEDKMEKGARREGKTAWEIAKFYEETFKEDILELNILEPSIWARATDHIPEQIEMIDKLIEKGFTYETSEGIYFDTTKIDDYGKLADLDKQELQAGARVEMGQKKNPHDFALWKFSKEDEKRQMEWDSPFNSLAGQAGRKGFPGWHIECSAMSMKYLGTHFDIHCGGIDHKTVHHPNEIAQSEAVTGEKPWVNVWMHNEHLLLKDQKMAKSGESFITLRELKGKGFDPLAYRYFLLQGHYRKQMNFTWEAMEAAQNGYTNLKNIVSHLEKSSNTNPLLKEKFHEAINDDLNTPEALAILWTGLKEKTIDLDMAIDFDKILGLNLHEPEKTEIIIPDEVQTLLDERKTARENKDWAKSDTLRDEIQKLGFTVEDTSEGQKIVLL